MFRNCATTSGCARESPYSTAVTDAVRVPGGVAGGATPVPIPNTEVKPSWADGTALATAWESRSLPGEIRLKGAVAAPFVLSGFGRPLYSGNTGRLLPRALSARTR